MLNKKIVLIGAGSAMFTQGLVYDLLSSKGEIQWELALVDTDPKALEIISNLCRKMMRAMGVTIPIACETDRKKVLGGADFVVSTIGVGGRRAWEQDVFIPRKYGVYQPVGDSVAPGGISRAMRMIPATVEIARDVEALCPDAYFFNYANPMTTICRAVRRATGVPIIGLCHGVNRGLNRLAGFASLKPGRLSGLWAGLNHFVIIYDLRYDGKPVFERIRDQIDSAGSSAIGPLSREFIRRYGAYPASDDRHYSEFISGIMREGGYFGKTLGVESYSFEGTIGWGDDIYSQAEQIAAQNGPFPAELLQKLEGEQEQLIDIILSIVYDKKEIYSVNIPCEGAVAGLPPYAVVEMPAAASGRGFLPLMARDFSTVFSGMLAKHIAIAEITVEAALHGDRRLFEEAVWLGEPLLDRGQVKSMVEDLIRAQAEYLPQF